MRLAPVSNRRVECVWHSTTLRHRVHRCMPDYRRNRVAGGTYFVTVGPVVGGMQSAFHPTLCYAATESEIIIHAVGHASGMPGTS